MAYVPNANLRDLMTMAIDGGSAYWMNYVRNYNYRNVEVTRDPELNVTCIVCEVDVDGKGWKERTITPKTMRKALQSAAKVQQLTDWINKMLNDPDQDYDDDDADIALQLAAFGDIVFS